MHSQTATRCVPKVALIEGNCCDQPEECDDEELFREMDKIGDVVDGGALNTGGYELKRIVIDLSCRLQDHTPQHRL